MLRQQIYRSLLFGSLLALGLAIVLAVLFSLLSWLENPSGIFRDGSGTNWRFVYDTATSWFLPTLGYTLPIFCFSHFLYRRLISARKTHKLAGNNKTNIS